MIRKSREKKNFEIQISRKKSFARKSQLPTVRRLVSSRRAWWCSKHARDGEKVDRIAAKMELNRLDFQSANLMPQRKRNLDHLGKN